ncbi:MAG: ArgE/DapE family deacylase [Candidatus Omnitrophota bacterium]|nr:MAG: ArgE/DapE family deacylase [Candidatus Omnitrophota bacterium]
MWAKKELVTLLQKLIKIDSQNPPGNEKEITFFIRDYLKKLQIPFKIYEFKKNRLNLVCHLHSKKSRKALLFTPHTDTVPASGDWKFPALSGKVYKGRIYGRGATDCKVNVAACLALIKALKKKNIVLDNLDLVFAFCGDEETGSLLGIKPVVNHLKDIDYGIVLDAGEFDIIVAQKGLLHLRVELFGKEAHGAYPQRGINAVEKGVRILTDLLKHKFSYRKHALLKKPTLNIGKFQGGDKVNIVAGYAFFDLDIRYLPSMKESQITKDLEKIIKRYKIRYKIKILARQSPIEIDKNSFLIKVLGKCLREHRIPVKFKPSFGATVINFLEDKGIETFSFGFGSKGCAHIKNEYVKISNLYRGVRVLEDFLTAADLALAKKLAGN